MKAAEPRRLTHCAACGVPEDQPHPADHKYIPVKAAAAPPIGDLGGSDAFHGWTTKEAVASIALDGGTRRACNDPYCGNDWPCATHPDEDAPKGETDGRNNGDTYLADQSNSSAYSNPHSVSGAQAVGESHSRYFLGLNGYWICECGAELGDDPIDEIDAVFAKHQAAQAVGASPRIQRWQFFYRHEYIPEGMSPREDGPWVKYADHEKRTADLQEQLRQAALERARYKRSWEDVIKDNNARVEQLRQAQAELKSWKDLGFAQPETIRTIISESARLAKERKAEIKALQSRLDAAEKALRAIAYDSIVGKIIDSTATWYRSIARAALAPSEPAQEKP